ncbi:hypothetical protein GQ43DRAFT_373670 [Delitschia confertaspora ATCC 74209]|uniref:HMG box domain-containing protein n=1 Tax=Delitschia confertaspora ATCC 74209 TaxID=1513339 RepID=A0A9P4JJD4_9PLEO|nr:hypothetical protein GQ43DRAFT_373670 [Delitschia confertaspora ATCC 74209]
MGDDAAIKDETSARNTRKSNRMQPGSISPPRSAQHSKDLQEPSPVEPPSARMTGKKAQSLNEEVEIDEQDSTDDSPRIQSAPTSGFGDLSGGHVCLCQPGPKIPRPRNAFILYRQHHQHAIVARNPGLANPEISKIIGEQWKAENDTEKKVWQDLAQEEKARHQEQYPEYRYQPRRLGKPGSLPSNLSEQHATVDKYRCPRCGGRSIKTPTSPFLNTSGIPCLPPPNISDNLTPTIRYIPMMNNLDLESPALRRQRPGPSNLSNIQVPTLAAVDTPMYSPLSPDSKRRRYDYPDSGRRSDTGPYYTHARRESLPPIRQSPLNTATMAPPRTPRRVSADLSVMLSQVHDQSRSVEAMAMSVPYNIKIRVLGRITPPLKEPGPTSPANQVRGAILAVEGDDLAAIGELSTWLKDFLEKDKEYHPRIAQPPTMSGEDKKDVTFEDYLDLIREWHAKSREMIEFITTPMSPPAISNSTDSNSTNSNASSHSEPSNAHVSTSPKPIVILPTYQLHASNVYTSRIPITDAYSPTDHWQWMATLWRGTVGPDLTIYVESGERKEGGTSKLVEVDDQVRYLTVRKEKGARFEDSALRRVGFEVGEWVRGIGSKWK